ncbi:26136_t:CDS:2, partial [Dentiscutata erythropus]
KPKPVYDQDLFLLLLDNNNNISNNEINSDSNINIVNNLNSNNDINSDNDFNSNNDFNSDNNFNMEILDFNSDINMERYESLQENSSNSSSFSDSDESLTDEYKENFLGSTKYLVLSNAELKKIKEHYVTNYNIEANQLQV